MEKNLNQDWTTQEDKILHHRDVVCDVEGNLGIVTKLTGDLTNKLVCVENEFGEEVYTFIDCKEFMFADFSTSSSFHIKYKCHKGWKIGNVYVIKGNDYPLILVNMKYNHRRKDVDLFFRDLNVQVDTNFRSTDEYLIEKIDESLQEMAKSAFVRDETSRFSHAIEVNVRELDSLGGNGWSVSGQSFSFPDELTARKELDKWIARMKARRMASVLSYGDYVGYFTPAMTPEGQIYIVEHKEKLGQPGVFNSRVCTALAIQELGEDVWKKVLDDSIDMYDL